jgi:hypothetical protein
MKKELIEAIQELIEEYADATPEDQEWHYNGNYPVLNNASTESFQSKGILSMDDGFMIRLKDGSEYQITIIQTKRNNDIPF